MSAYIAGVTAPAGRKMGHAGAIVSGGKGTAQGKMDALAAAGVQVGLNPTEAGELMAAALRSAVAPTPAVQRRPGARRRRRPATPAHIPGAALQVVRDPRPPISPAPRTTRSTMRIVGQAGGAEQERRPRRLARPHQPAGQEEGDDAGSDRQHPGDATGAG